VLAGLIKILRGSRGMTLVEVMMAVAVFGIIIAFTTQMTTTSNRISGDNYNRVRMMELAQAEMERIRAGGPTLIDTLNYGSNHIVAYPPGATGSDVETSFAVTYHRDLAASSNVTLQVVVGPANGPNPPDPNNPDNYLLVAWLP